MHEKHIAPIEWYCLQANTLLLHLCAHCKIALCISMTSMKHELIYHFKGIHILRVRSPGLAHQALLPPPF